MKTNTKMIAGIIATLLILFLITFYNSRPLTEEERWELRRDAYDFAVECSGIEVPKLQFEEINWAIVPGNKLIIEATDGTARLQGYFQVDTNTIWIPSANQDLFWLNAHEIMHSIGYVGHPDHPFRTCKLMSDQN